MKLHLWITLVGERGQRPIRLSKSFRSFYRVVDGAIEFLDVFDVNHHEY